LWASLRVFVGLSAPAVILHEIIKISCSFRKGG
jgi:hypothetical protein